MNFNQQTGDCWLLGNKVKNKLCKAGLYKNKNSIFLNKFFISSKKIKTCLLAFKITTNIEFFLELKFFCGCWKSQKRLSFRSPLQSLSWGKAFELYC
ncbi:unnamed protein product [Enterobius vermicularis]|uniref:Uncharacterized protein n=1 Tax=Enterobius vermicularis TaxID=51028 RepID=A0A0N4VEX5_ENTVE|nr:unnamed protein product [Enterobius vermicularis]